MTWAVVAKTFSVGLIRPQPNHPHPSPKAKGGKSSEQFKIPGSVGIKPSDYCRNESEMSGKSRREQLEFIPGRAESLWNFYWWPVNAIGVNSENSCIPRCGHMISVDLKRFIWVSLFIQQKPGMHWAGLSQLFLATLYWHRFVWLGKASLKQCSLLIRPDTLLSP